MAKLRRAVRGSAPDEAWAAYDVITDPVLVTDEHDGICYANPAVTHLFGWEAGSLIGCPLATIVLAPGSGRDASPGAAGAGERADTENDPTASGASVRSRGGATIEVVLRRAGLVATRGARYRVSVLTEAAPAMARERRSVLSRMLLEVLSERQSASLAIARILEVVGTSLGWDVALFWSLEGDAAQLRCSSSWAAPGTPAARLRSASEGSLFPAGIDLPGRVWETGEPAWSATLARDRNFLRHQGAQEDGLSSGFAFPLCSHTRFVGVIECFSARPRAEDPVLVASIEGIGDVLGDFLERRASEEDRQRLLHELETERARLDAVLRQLPAAVLIAEDRPDDGEDRCVSGNDRAAEVLGPALGPGSGSLSRFVHEMRDRAGRPYPDEALPLYRALRDGIAVGPEELDIALPDGRAAVVSTTAAPVRDPHGRVVASVAVVNDVTRQRRREHHYRLLAEASTVLARSLDRDTTLQAVSRLAVPDFADLCLVDVVDAAGMPTRVVATFADPAVERIGRRLSAFAPRPGLAEGPARVLRSGEAVLYREVTDELLVAVACDDEHLALLRSLRPSSTVTVPLVGRGRTLGTLTFSSLDPDRRFDDEDTELAVELGRRAGVAVANAQLYARERELATTLQRSLLPPGLPRIPGLDVAARVDFAGEGLVVGGDFYDLFPTPFGWALTIGDVCGTGAEAAAVTAHVRYVTRALAQYLDPAAVLSHVNASLLAESNDLRFCTAIHGRIRPRRRGLGLSLCSAGHPPPVLVAADGAVSTLACSGTLLGVLDEPTFVGADVDLEAGETLVLYTDGVTEASGDHDRFGTERLHATLAAAVTAAGGAAGVAEAVLGAVARFTGEQADDDRAVMVLRVGLDGPGADDGP